MTDNIHKRGKWIQPHKMLLPRLFAGSLWIILITAVAFTQAAQGDPISGQTSNDQSFTGYKTRLGLVIGIETYVNWPPKEHAVKDARDVSWELRRRNYTVRLMQNPGAAELRTAISKLVQEAAGQQECGVVVYYSGQSHTDTSTEGNREGWLIASDAPRPGKDRSGFEQKAVRISELNHIADQLRDSHILFLFNAAFDSDVFHIEPNLLKTDRKISGLPTCQFISAGSEATSVSDQLAFGRFLLLGLQGEADLVYDGVIHASELGLYLANRVSSVTMQREHPLYGRLAMSEDNLGDYAFIRTDRKNPMGRLFVDANPASAVIRIMNIKPRFFQGMELSPGIYHLKVSDKGHDSVERSITLAAGEDRTERIELPRISDVMTNSIGMQFKRIKPGNFTMGSPTSEPGRSNDETRHKVKLTRSFFIQQTEVTMAQFKQFVRAGGYRTEAEKGGGCWIKGTGGRGWSRKKGTSWKQPGAVRTGSNLPVVCVTWNDAMAFARWLSDKEGRHYRLPTEAEWEYTARAGTYTPFAFGRCLDSEEANYARVDKFYQRCTTVFHKKRGRIIAAGALKPNPWRLHDMHGNAAEWCLDWYGPYASGSVTVDPQGPETATDRVIRGGHWQAGAAGCRSARRVPFPPGFASDVVGFRLAIVD